jgi:amino acid adenylation domain-containing protein
VAQLNLLTAEERNQILVEWNQTERDYPRDKCVHELFDESVKRAPDAIAVEFCGQQLTYFQLNVRAEELTGILHRAGVGPDVIVPLCLERSLEMVVAVLAILKAGGAYLPLDPTLPPERLNFMIQESGAPLILTHSKLQTLFAEQPTRLLCLDSPQQTPERPQRGEIPNHRSSSENIAYVIYTSGSTGKPKGVPICHRSVVNLITGITDQLQLTAHDVFLAVTTLSFDIATAELFVPLSLGAKVVLVPQAVAADGQQLLAILEKTGATFLQPTPATWRLLLAAGWKGTPTLKMVSTGEALSADLARELLPRGKALWNLYGPTETTIWSTAGQITSAQGPIHIGRPLANTQVYILDQTLQPVPVGVAGELFIGGDGLARGYLDRPELTAEQFISHPFGARPGERLYRTRDLARYRADGMIECLGRLDHQVKIRGYRIELGEIEATLSTHPAIASCVAHAFVPATGERQLVAYCVARAPTPPSVSELREHLRRTLPEYMIPAFLVFLPNLPLSPNGKVDRKALPDPSLSDLVQTREIVPPRNVLELELTRIWQQIFQRHDIGALDNFFELGGHSLLAARMGAEIEASLRCKMPMATLFQSPTIADLAQQLSESNWKPRWSSLVPLQPSGSKRPLFLVHGWGGDVFGFVDLARLLAPDQPVYGLQAVGLDGKMPRHTSIEAMALYYTSELRQFQPAGPYDLAGYSMGGLIAYEMAQRLHEQGHRVALLALLDTVPLGGVSWRIYGRVMLSYLSGRFVFHLRRCWRMPNQDRLKFLRNLRSILKYWSAQNRSKPVNLIAPPAVGITQAPEVAGFKDYYQALASAYRVQSYPGTVDVFVSEDAPTHWVACWPYLACGGASFHPIPGKHLQLFSSDYLPSVAKTLRTVLQGAQDKA